MESRLERLLPLAGVAFAIVFVIGFLGTGDTPDPDAGTDEIFKYYDDAGKVFIGIVALALASILFMLFASALRTYLRNTGPEWLGTLAFAAAVIFVVGLTLFATSQFSLLQAADNKDMESLKTLNTIDGSNFPTTVIGLALLYLSVGWHGLKAKSVPTWFAWISLVFGVLGIAGPIGFIAFLGVMPWTLIMGIVLYRRQDATVAVTA